MSEHTPLLARQPIFNRRMEVEAYELLWRTSDRNSATFNNPDMATSQVLLRTFTEFTIDQVVGKHKAYINFTRALLLAPPPFDKSQLVIEILEGQRVDAELLHSLKRLREQGYAIALDDFELTEETLPLVAYADIIKLDVLSLSKEQLLDHVCRLKDFAVILLAEKVETYEMLAFCKDAGFDLFQGYFLAKPKIIKGHKLTENKQAVLQLMAILHNPDASITQVERCISRDPMLSYKLLRLVNSAAFSLPRTIESLRQAITLLGLNNIKNWVNLLVMANLDDKPTELSVAALTRARLCEVIASASGKQPHRDTFFTVGLLSTLDAFMDMPLDVLLGSISLSQQLSGALLEHSGEEGKVLAIVEHYERAEWDAIDWDYLGQRGISPDRLAQMYLEALGWVSDTLGSMGVAVSPQS